jgi:AcrR family transcriptional regulator
MSNDEAATGNHRRYRGVGGEERKAERRQRLIGAGLQVFGQSGYHGATIKAICTQAGLTERYFYESFSNSEDLLCAVYEQHMVLQQERIRDAVLMAEREPTAMITAGIGAFFALTRENPEGSRVQFVEVLGVSPRVDRLYRQSIENFAQMLRNLNLQLPSREFMPSLDEETLSIGLVGAAVGIASRWLLLGFTPPQETMVATTLTIFMGVWQRR